MTRKIARQSDVTPTNTIDDYLWNERLGVTQLPPVDMSQQGQSANPSSLPPQPSQAPAIEYDSSVSQSDAFGSGVSGAEQLIAPKAPNTTPASVPARSKAAAAVSTLYGDVSPTPTTGESGNDGAQANRNNSSEHLPNGPDSGAPTGSSAAAAGEEEGGAGLAADLGEAGSLALLANKHWVGSALDPKEDDMDWKSRFAGKDSDGKKDHYKYIRHNSKTGKWEIWQKGTGKTLSTHDSKEKAIEAFKAMMSHMHG